jgi:hypothetical protein
MGRIVSIHEYDLKPGVNLWGTPEHPRPSREYPDSWKVWEEDLLAPFLRDHPDRIRFTAYEELPN